LASADEPAFGVDSDLPVPFEVACQCQRLIWIQAKRLGGEFGFCGFRGIHMPRQRSVGLQLGHRASGGDSDQHERRGGYDAAASLGPQAKAAPFKVTVQVAAADLDATAAGAAGLRVAIGWVRRLPLEAGSDSLHDDRLRPTKILIFRRTRSIYGTDLVPLTVAQC
jgi:hypothetical protein